MDNTQKEGQQPLPGKKELKKQLAEKMETALPELKDMLGEKKFVNRLKKAAKLLIEGLHKEDKPKTGKQSAKKAAPKKATVKKAAANKAAGKKNAATTKAKAAPARKAKAATKKNASK